MKKILIITSFVLFIGAAIVLLAATRTESNTKITVAPTDSKIQLDGYKYINSGNVYINPGKHVIKVSRDGFKTNEKSFMVNDGGTVVVWVGLSPSDKKGDDYVKSHEEEFVKLEQTANADYEKGSSTIGENSPLISQLPVDFSPSYRIDYGSSKKYPDDKLKVAIYISSNNPTNKITALQYIYRLGYDPSDYEIIFKAL